MLAKEYLEGGIDLYNLYIKPNILPKFIATVKRPGRSGYRCILPGYEKTFSSMKISDNEKLILAINYLKSIQEKGSTTKC